MSAELAGLGSDVVLRSDTPVVSVVDESDWAKCPVTGGWPLGGELCTYLVFRPGLFDGQTIMITGGGSGIGRCVRMSWRAWEPWW